MGPKLWTPAKVRELARKRLKEQEEQKTPALPQPYFRSETPLFSWGSFEKSSGENVVVVIPWDSEDDGDEIRLLCETLGLGTLELFKLSKNRKPDPATYLGKGFAERMREVIQKREADALVVDVPLSPVQVRNLEDLMKCPVLDRQAVILGIFKHHARSKMAKLQVELAQLKYLQPRLSGIWQGLSRQSGGAGGRQGRGLGETRLELDRRVIKDRISSLSKKLKEAEKSARLRASKRSSLPRVALVGYTNAGKSSLMRILTKSEVEAKNELFSTLDTTVRALNPPTEPRILLSDTVGFVRDLPHDLVASFKSTLQEAIDSDLLIHVLDASHEHWRTQIDTTEETLNEIGAGDIPRLMVLNKIDLLGMVTRLRVGEVSRHLRRYPSYLKVLALSAQTREGVAELREEILSQCGAQMKQWGTQENYGDA